MEAAFLLQDTFRCRCFQETCYFAETGDPGVKIRLACSAETTAPEVSRVPEVLWVLGALERRGRHVIVEVEVCWAPFSITKAFRRCLPNIFWWHEQNDWRILILSIQNSPEYFWQTLGRLQNGRFPDQWRNSAVFIIHSQLRKQEHVHRILKRERKADKLQLQFLE